MTKNFTKTLIAVALTAAVGSAHAGNLVQPTATSISKQGITSLTVAAPALSFAIGSTTDYAIGSTITVTFSAGELAVAPTAVCADSVATTNDCAGVTLTRTAQTATSATFTVGGAVLDATPTDGVLSVSITGAEFTKSSLANASSISATILSKQNTSVVIDEATGTDRLSRVVLGAFDQAASTVTENTETINLASLRTKFVGTGNDAKQAVFNVVTTTTTTPAAAGGVTYAAFTGAPTADATAYTVKGDFSFLKDTDASKDGIQPAAGTLTFTDSASCSLTTLTAAQMLYSCVNAATSGGFILDVFQGGTASPIALPDTVFTVSAEKTFKNGSVETKLATVSAKTITTFKNDGKSFAIDYMPLSETTSSVIYLKNYSDVEGAVYVTATDENGVKVLDRKNIGKAPKSGIFWVSNGLATELKAAGFKAGKLSLKIDAEVTDAQVFSAYNANGDRLNSNARGL